MFCVAPLGSSYLLQPFMIAAYEPLTWMAKMDRKPTTIKKDKKSQCVFILLWTYLSRYRASSGKKHLQVVYKPKINNFDTVIIGLF